IALIGHSRGGEAAALAATFNSLSRYPNNARVAWQFNFNIRAVAAIAPVDEQWQPADQPNPLENVSYLVLQGSHDADLYFFDGIQQYNRTTFTDPQGDGFKAAVYIYRANHGQFNTTWGDRDSSGVKGQFLNRKALLPAQDQQQIAEVFITAFLEVTLKGNQAYRSIFEDYRLAGDWLPQTNYITQYEDYGIRLVADFEEDVDVLTCTLPGCVLRTSGLSRWNESAIRFRNRDRQENHVVRVGWSGLEGSYALRFSLPQDWQPTPETLLVFKAADAREPEDAPEGLDFSMVLVDRWGNQASIRLSDLLPLQTQFPAEISRLAVWNESYYKEASEEVFQTYRIPLNVFADVTPGLDLAGLKEIRFQFDQSPSGSVYLDEIGFDLVP
ncbi:MAG: MFS transporter, partial [Anaerolineales bacterium]